MHIFHPVVEKPALGRLLRVTHRYRWREAPEEERVLPKDASFEVLDAKALDGASFLTNHDGMCVVTPDAHRVLAPMDKNVLWDEVPCSDGKGNVWLARIPETEAEMEDSDGGGGYGTVTASSITIDECEHAIARVSGTTLLVFSDEVVGALKKAKLDVPKALDPSKGFTDWAPAIPYSLMYVKGEGARFSDDHVEAVPPIKGIPKKHPVLEHIRHEDPEDDEPDRWWGQMESRAVHQAFTSGTPIKGGLRAKMEPPKSAKKLNAFLSLNFLVMDDTTRAFFENGVVAEWVPFTVLDHGGKEVKDKYWFCVPPVADWFDWERSDVNWTGSNTIWGVYDIVLKPVEGTQPLVRLANTTIYLVHDKFREVLEKTKLPVRFEPVHHYVRAVNLDHQYTQW